VAEERSYKGEIDASEILAKIEKGEDVDCDGYIIKGNLDISGLKLPEEIGEPAINSKISIIKSCFDGFVKFTNVVFKKDVNFSGTIFNGKYENELSANFSGTTFSDSAFFSDTTFSSRANFRDVTFSKSVYFSGYARFFMVGALEVHIHYGGS
jgi:hypothetical protein